MHGPWLDVAGRRVVVAGAARSGVAAARLLSERGAAVTLSDVNTAVPGLEDLPGVRLELGGHGLETFTGADLVVLSPGVPATQPAVASPLASTTRSFSTGRTRTSQ